jgi:hypothetical protein
MIAHYENKPLIRYEKERTLNQTKNELGSDLFGSD